LFQNLVMSPASETRLRHHLQIGLQIKAATDGSMEFESRCSFAWTLHTQNSRHSIATQTAACVGLVDGDSSQNSLTRAELFGLASVPKFLHT
jgi:hypothetical protein